MSGSLTVSGNEITDASRALALAGDGLTSDSSFGIWEATTNLVTNGGFESNTTGWSPFNATLSRVANPKFGANAMRVTRSAAGLFAANWTTTTISGATAGRSFTASAWIYAPADAVGLAITVRIYEQEGASGQQWTTATPTLVAGWQRVSVSRTLAQNDRTNLYLELAIDTGDPAYFEVDGVQIEEQPIATPYVETDGGSASRSAGRVQAPASLLDETQGWVALRVRMGWGVGAEPHGGASFPHLMLWQDSGSERLVFFYNEGSNTWGFDRDSGAGSNAVTVVSAHARGDVITIIAAWTSTQIKLSVNGAAFSSAANTTIPTLAASTFDIGSAASSLSIDSDILWFASGTGTLTDADAATLHAFGNSDHAPGDFPGTCTAVIPFTNTVYLASGDSLQPRALMGVGV